MVSDLGFRAYGLGLEVWAFKVLCVGCRVQGVGSRVWGLGLGLRFPRLSPLVQCSVLRRCHLLHLLQSGLGIRVQGLGFRV
jgi:hypothetical protein